MGMHVLRLETAEARELAAKLPQGRVFASGRAFVPFVKAGLYGSLAAIAQVDPTQGPPDPDPASAAFVGPHERRNRWRFRRGAADPRAGTLAVGSVVLAFDGPMGLVGGGGRQNARRPDHPPVARLPGLPAGCPPPRLILHLPPGVEVG